MTTIDHSEAITALANRIARTKDLEQANSFAPAVAALATDTDPDDTDDSNPDYDNVGDAFPELPPNKTIQCTTAFRAGSVSLTAQIAAVNKELKAPGISAAQKAGLEKNLATLDAQMGKLIATYTECLRKAVAFL